MVKRDGHARSPHRSMRGFEQPAAARHPSLSRSNTLLSSLLRWDCLHDAFGTVGLRSTITPVHVFCGLSSSLSGWRCSFGRAPVSVFENPMHTSVTLRTRAHKKPLHTEIELDHVALFSRWYAAYVSRVGISALCTVYPVYPPNKSGVLWWTACLPD